MNEPKLSQPVLARRDLVRSMFAASTLAFLSACGATGAAGSASSADIKKNRRTLRVGMGDIACIDPFNAKQVHELQVTYQLFDALTTYDFVEGELKPLAAASYAGNEDATEFTFKIKSATFHNGETVTSTSFKRAWERLVDPASAVAAKHGASSFAYLLSLVQGYSELASGSATGLSGVACPDDETLVVTLTSSYGDFPYLCAHPALAPVPTQATSDPDGFFMQPVGNGAYTLSAPWSTGKDIVLAPFDGYYGDAPGIQRIKFVHNDGTEASYKDFQAEKLDVSDVPVDDIAAKASGTEAEERTTLTASRHYIQLPELTLSYLAVNTESSQLSDAAVRRAISYAVNRENICSSVYSDATLPATCIVPPLCPGYRETAWDCCHYDVDQANTLLEDVAPMDGKTRGIVLTCAYDKSGGGKELVEALVDDLARVGIELTPTACTFEELQDSLTSGGFELAVTSWTSDAPCMDTFLYPLVDSACLGGNNVSRYSNADVDAKLAEGRATLDDDERIARFQEAEDMVAADAPIIPLMHYTRGVCAADRVDGLCVDPVGKPHFAQATLAH